MSEHEKRMAGTYEIINSLRIGPKEIVLGVDKNSVGHGQFYCGNCECNEILELFTNGVVSDNYPAIVQVFAERVAEAAKDMMAVVEEERKIVGDDRLLTIQDCSAPDSWEESVVNRVVVIDGNILRPEYQRASHQLVYVTGGNGAYAHARGRKIFTKSLLNGQDNTFYRQDILGVVDVDQLPTWAKDGYDKVIVGKERGSR